MLNGHIETQIGERVEAYRSEKTQDENEQFKSILDVALEAYYSDSGRLPSEPVAPDFLQMLYSQMRMFFFAGYDSTTPTMVYCCYTIWKHPDVLSRLQAEHDSVLGRNVPAASDKITENPAILNSLTYTNAVIKETMRFFPAANGIRQGCRDLMLRDREGNDYPTDGCPVQVNHMRTQRDPNIWVRTDEFLPERFLVEPGHELYPPKGAWRAFEYGPRMCTGQALVIKELKAFLALVAGEFDIMECYDEFDGGWKPDLSNVFGDNVYQVEAGSAHPRNQYPCRISLSGYQAGGKV